MIIHIVNIAIVLLRICKCGLSANEVHAVFGMLFTSALNNDMCEYGREGTEMLETMAARQGLFRYCAISG